MRHPYSAIYDNVRIRPLVENDIESLRNWRNDTKKTKFLRKIPYITSEMQKKWYMEYLENQDEIIFAIDEICELNRMVGSVALYSFNDDVAEIGKIQIGDEEANGRGIGRKSMVMAMNIAFKFLGVKKIVGSVHQDNIVAHKVDTSIGFNVVGNHEAPMGGLEDEIEIDAERLAEVNEYVGRIKVEVRNE